MNPVLVNDLRKSMVRRKPVYFVGYMALTILALVFIVDAFVPTSPLAYRGLYSVWRYPDVLLPLLAPAFAAGAFAREREQRTWQDLMLTRLTGTEILLGKVMSSAVQVFGCLVILLPPYFLALSLQNVYFTIETGPWLFVFLGKLVICVTFYVGAALVCSYYCPNGRVALVVTYACFAGYAIVNYLAWTYVAEPLLLEPPVPFGSYARTGFGYGGSTGLDLTPVDWLVLVQYTVLGVGLLVYLSVRLRRRAEVS